MNITATKPTSFRVVLRRAVRRISSRRTRILEIFSSGCPTCFTDLLAQDGIALVTGKYGKSLAEGQKNNIAPRLGFAYQVSPKLVVRGGFGIFYNGFENRGFSPNLGENYPFQFNFSFFNPIPATRSTILLDAPRRLLLAARRSKRVSPARRLDPLLVNANGLGSARNPV